MNDERFEALLAEAAREYNLPPEPPRDAMWEAIRAERQNRSRPRKPSQPPAWQRPIVRPWHWGMGMAAMLALGIGLGRLTVQTPNDTGPVGSHVVEATQPAARPTEGASLPYRLAATHHLSRTEAFLTTFRDVARAGQPAPELAEWARELLTGTRLLLDSPAARDRQMRTLLEDLELVLAQIAHIASTDRAGDEIEWIDQALEQRATLTRLRASVPAGPAPTGT